MFTCNNQDNILQSRDLQTQNLCGSRSPTVLVTNCQIKEFWNNKKGHLSSWHDTNPYYIGKGLKINIQGILNWYLDYVTFSNKEDGKFSFPHSKMIYECCSIDQILMSTMKIFLSAHLLIYWYSRRQNFGYICQH